MEKISDNVYVETGFEGCNVGFVVTGEGVVMIDTPQIPTDAIDWRDEIKKYGPVRYLINTEPLGGELDYANGLHIRLRGTNKCFLRGFYGFEKNARAKLLQWDEGGLK